MSSGLKTLTPFSPSPFPFPFRSRRPPLHLYRKLRLSVGSGFSPLCDSDSDRGRESCLAHGVKEVSPSKILQVVLVSPQVMNKFELAIQLLAFSTLSFEFSVILWQIPGNTGCIARTCAASAVGLHLVGVHIAISLFRLFIYTQEN